MQQSTHIREIRINNNSPARPDILLKTKVVAEHHAALSPPISAVLLEIISSVI